MNIIRIKEEHEIKEFINTLFNLQLNGNNVFRGYSNENELSPSLVRNFQNIRTKHNLIKYERFLLEKYSHYSIQYLPSYDSYLDWVASAQHFGLPTRLIDWSYDPFIALFFSVFYNKKPQNNIYKLIVTDLDKNMYFEKVPTFPSRADRSITSNHRHIDNYFELVTGLLSNGGGIFRQIYNENTVINFVNKHNQYIEKENSENRHMLFFCSLNQSNARIISQKGLFQIPRRFIIQNNESNIIIKDDILNAAEIIFEIDKNLRSSILQILEKMNIRMPLLFPDLSNICNYIKNLSYE